MLNTKQDGWIKLHRKSINSSVWGNPMLWMVWSWILLKATHQPSKFFFNGKDIEIREGQFITGRNKALSEIPTSTPQRLRSIIKYLKSTNRITCKSTNQFTLITVVNWENYQQSNQQNNQQINQPITNEQPTDNQRITTYKNVKNVKNVKNIKNTKKKDSAINNLNLSLKADIKKIIDDLNLILGTKYRDDTPQTTALIKKRLEKYTIDDFKKVHRKKFKEWKDDERMNKFLRPETLYGSKFESYLNQIESKQSEVPDFVKKLRGEK